jgi:hypothetical protein
VRVGEARIFPNEPDGDGRNGGAWSGCWWGIDAAAPRRGLTKRVLSLAQPHRWLQSAEKVNQEFRRAFPKGVQLPKAVGQRAPRSKTGRRGRPGHTDEFLAQIADEYVRALKKGRFPVKTVAAQHEAKEAKVRGWIYRARERGFLSQGAQGRAGGKLEPKAMFRLEAQRPRPNMKTDLRLKKEKKR